MKDEAPKAPVFVYSVRADNTSKLEPDTEEERVNLQMREDLTSLNNSLFLSEAHENIDFLIPFDEVSIGSKQKVFLENYQKDSSWHRSGLESLVPSTIASVL